MGYIGEDEETHEVELVPEKELDPATAPHEVPAEPAKEPVPA